MIYIKCFLYFFIQVIKTFQYHFFKYKNKINIEYLTHHLEIFNLILHRPL